ncbi:MAG: type II toxin-antitoxin system VapC family toxin [Calditrichaceae bacterium]
MNIYFDSSAWTKRYILEQGTEEVESICFRAEKITLSILCVPEVVSAFTRLKREGRITPEQYNRLQKSLYEDIVDVKLINIAMEAINQAVNMIQKFPLRTLNALHIACAGLSKTDLFVSADARQLTAAEGIGLEVRYID